jgi:hypothetical protein
LELQKKYIGFIRNGRIVVLKLAFWKVFRSKNLDFAFSQIQTKKYQKSDFGKFFNLGLLERKKTMGNYDIMKAELK